MHAAQLLIDELQERNELVALILVEEMVEAYRTEDEDRAAWQLQSNNEVARMCEAILQTWRGKAAKQKDEENNVLRERHHAEALARQRSLVSTVMETGREETPKKSPSPTRRGQEFHPTENGSSGDYIVTSGMDFSRLQAAFSEAIPTTAATNSIEVNKLQEQISKWREGAKAQIEAESRAQMKKWKDQIHNQLSAEGKVAAIRAIEKERKTEKLNLIHDAHKRGVLLPREEIEEVLEAADDDDDDEDDDGIDGPSVEAAWHGLGQGSVASIESGISAITADTANVVGGKSKDASNKLKLSPTGKMKAKQGSLKQHSSQTSIHKTSVKKKLRAEALKAYKRLEAKYVSVASSSSGDAEEELLKLQLQRQREIDAMVAEQKAHWQAVTREEKLQQMAREAAEAEERMEKERKEREAQEREAREKEEERVVAIEKEWRRLQKAAEQEKDEKEKKHREKTEAAEVALGVKHRHAPEVKEKIDAKKALKKLTKSQKRVEKEHKRQLDRLFPKRHDEISREAVKKERAERARIRKEREKFHMVGMTFSSKEKEEVYLHDESYNQWCEQVCFGP